MNYPKTRNENIVVQEMEKEILIYDLKTNKAFCLNETSAIIYQLCDGKNSVAEITLALNQNLNQSVSEDLVWLALDNFKKDNLLENNEQFEINFKGLSRRQVIKKIGLASMIALPVIASVVAPNAAMAFSGFANCAACTTNSQCAVNNCLNNVCSVGMTNSFAPNTMLGAPFSVPSGACTALASANCCSGNRIWFVTNNCFCG
ncbi:MAG: PqqD family protein [Pyrinomonadaceae bacterium]|nr:PqqD family protein [Pyrinomonadaceae bacterium]